MALGLRLMSVLSHDLLERHTLHSQCLRQYMFTIRIYWIDWTYQTTSSILPPTLYGTLVIFVKCFLSGHFTRMTGKCPVSDCYHKHCIIMTQI